MDSASVSAVHDQIAAYISGSNGLSGELFALTDEIECPNSVKGKSLLYVGSMIMAGKASVLPCMHLASPRLLRLEGPTLRDNKQGARLDVDT